ncbi:vWA domain-containing protein [Bacillus testis]|uniref:vWA domain-containing protein n=1 Tax=Bacillus testis TaxID=1622072 RepID=UPI00067ECEAB|nr:VWA domain-containing protein [Bacillus testis]
MRNPIVVTILALLLLVSGGCSQEQDSQTKGEPKTKIVHQKKNKSEEAQEDSDSIEEPPLPTSYTELEQRPVGEFYDIPTNFNKEDEEHIIQSFQDLPDISKNPSDEKIDQFYRKLLKMAQNEYKGPEEMIRKLRFQSIGDPSISNPRYQFKENLNVEILLDASGSMAQNAGGSNKMAAAKDAIRSFVQELPKEARVGIRVYGNKGSNAESDKELSCSSTELAYPLSAYDQTSFELALGNIKPTGWTPTGLALTEALKDLASFDGKTNTNIVYLVSDGVSTCGDQPIEAAKKLFTSDTIPIVNVIGFDVDSKGQNELKEIARATDGLYSNVTDPAQLNEELSHLKEVTESWNEWRKLGKQNLEGKHIQNNIDIFAYIAHEEATSTFEETKISLIIGVLQRYGKLSKETRDVLEQKNKEYHQWIDEEISRFETELKALNDQGYAEALNALEQKYKQNIE